MQSEQIDSSHYHDEGAPAAAPKKSQLLQLLFIGSVVLFVFCAMIAVLLLNRFARNWITSQEEDNNTEMKFLIVGDYGREGQFNQKEVAHEMGEWCKDNGKCDFIIGTGDNFYPDGARTENDPQFQDSFENIYTHEGIKNVRFYQIFGNHDYHQYPQSQLVYSKTKKTNFYIPYFYYSEVKQVNSLRVQIVFIDTNGFVESYKNFSRPTSRNLTAIQEAIDRADAQLQFIKSELARYPIRQGQAGDEYVDYKIVVGHHPTYTPEAFHSDLPELIALLNPILYQHGALFYIAGHSHVLSHIVSHNEVGHESLPKGVYYNLQHIISGAGSSTRPIREDVPNLLRSQTESGFIAAVAKKNKVTMKFINYKGEETSEFDAYNPFFIKMKD